MTNETAVRDRAYLRLTQTNTPAVQKRTLTILPVLMDELGEIILKERLGREEGRRMVDLARLLETAGETVLQWPEIAS